MFPDTCNQVSRRTFLAGAGALYLGACNRGQDPAANLETLRFGCLPYGDHTQAVIGATKGFFARAGIDLRYDTIRVEQAVPLLNSGRYDVVSVSPGLLLAAFNEAPNLQMFVYGSLFQGYALMAQPNSTARTYSEILRSERDPVRAARATIAQLRGARFAYPSEGGIRPFIELLLETGGLSRSDFTAIVVDDAIAVATMRRGDADFQVGGAPSRITLQKAGFRPIISAVEIASFAAPSPTSKALRAVFPDGWAARSDFIRQKRDLVLRLARVSFEINAYMRRDLQGAAQIHMNYLSRVTGQPFTAADASIIYRDLDPFLTFQEQQRWFRDQTYALYHRHVLGAHIQSYVDQGLYRGKRVPTVGDISVAEDIYQTLERSGGVSLPEVA